MEKTLAQQIKPKQRWLKVEVRYWQIAFQLSFLGLGLCWRHFNIQAAQMIGAVSLALFTQWFWMTKPWNKLRGSKGLSIPEGTQDFRKIFSPSHFLSALITSCGVSLLLRANDWWIHGTAVSLALSAKFLCTFRGKHIFNPANLAVIFALLFLPGSWVSPAQWGQEWLCLFWMIVLGLLVTARAKSLDISISFLVSWVSLLVVKVLYLGQVWAHFWHQLNNGALMVFAFFMLSDPMTIPNKSIARKLYAFLVAFGAFTWQFIFYRPNGFLWSLFVLSPLVPLLDLYWRGEKYHWRGDVDSRSPSIQASY